MKKRFSKNYYSLFKKHKKEIMSNAKWASRCPWDWGPGLFVLVEHLRFMKDYYENGENVIAMENYQWREDAIKKSRLEMVTEILNEFDGWQNCEEKYIKLVEHPETYKTHKNEDGTVTIDDLGCYLEYSLGDKDLTIKAYTDEYAFHKKKFFELLAEYIEELWD